MRNAVKSAGEGGFTLLEVLLATALTVVVLGAVYGTFFLVERASHGGQDSLLGLYEAQKTMDLLRRELEAANGPLRVIDKEYFGKHGSTLSFTAFSPKNGVLSDITYSAKEGGKKETITLEKQLQAQGQNAERAELLENIDRFSVQVYSGGKWVNTVNASSPPADIRVLLTVMFKGKPLTLEETVTPRIGRQLGT